MASPCLTDLAEPPPVAVKRPNPEEPPEAADIFVIVLLSVCLYVLQIVLHQCTTLSSNTMCFHEQDLLHMF